MKKTKIIIIILTIFFSSFLGFLTIPIFKRQINPNLKKYVETETKHFITNLIQEIVDDVSENKLDDDKIFSISRNSYDEIEIIDFNTKEVNDILEEITNEIEKQLSLLENGEVDKLNISKNFKGNNFIKLKKGVLFELGDDFLSERILFSNNDTKIPLRLSFVGNVYTSISTNIKNYGLNSAYMEVKVKVEVKENVVLPTFSDEFVIKEEFPIAIKIIQGKIPNYYNGEFESNSTTYSLPLKK